MNQLAKFRTNPNTRIVGFGVVFAVIGVVASLMAVEREDLRANLGGFLLVLGGIYVVFVVLLLLASLAFPVTVYDDGLRCYTGGAAYKTVYWTEIVSASPYGGYLDLELIDGGDPLTLPLDLRDMDRFRALVRQHAPKDSPLARALVSGRREETRAST